MRAPAGDSPEPTPDLSSGSGTLPRRQRTIARSVEAEGTGLHTGAVVRARLLPAPEGAGLVFVRADLDGRPRIAASAQNRVAYSRRTALECNGAEVHTIEHLLSAASGLGVDNLTVELEGFEAPGLDGSAKDWVALLRQAGVVDQSLPRAELVVRQRVVVEGSNDSFLVAEPWDGGLKLTYNLDYPEVRTLGQQTFECVVTEECFVAEVAPARTFVLEAESVLLRQLGMGLGANFQNTLVYTDTGVVENKLRFQDEAARHKTLDLLGDLALLGRSLRGHVVAHKSGHELNLALVKKLQETHPS